MEPNYQPKHSLHQGKFINDGFFPDLDLVTLQKRYRLDSNLSVEALYGSTLIAVIYVNQDLYPWVCQQMQAGYTKLAQIPSSTDYLDPPPTMVDDLELVNNSLASLHYIGLYEHAVFARVKGELTRENSHHTLGKEGVQRHISYHDLSNDYYRQSIWAVRQIMVKKRVRAGFI